MNKTNVIRLLEANKISHEIKTYDFDESDLSGISVAKKIGIDEDFVFKTLVADGDKTGYLVFCIPVNSELNLKKAARASDNKNVELIPVKNLLNLTGYVRGGCSPIGMKKKFPTFIDETAQLCEKIFFSAGIRGIQIGLLPDDLLKVTDASYADLI
ncbi:MAG: Cys-tRNA(Pro) deacylase [Ignavibacteriaceae bacterium]|nr:Cys-tRNA(Pro) deacylase [Ignavibacteriaceae bacterium]